MPAEGTGISWLEEEQPLSLCPRSLALEFGLLCSRLELVYKQGFGLGSLLLHRGGDREPGQALGFSTLLRLSYKTRDIVFIDNFTVIAMNCFKHSRYSSTYYNSLWILFPFCWTQDTIVKSLLPLNDPVKGKVLAKRNDWMISWLPALPAL